MSETTMKDLYEEGRPYEKCLAGGPEKLTDTELLAVMIRTGTYGESACRLAERILSLPGYEGLPGLRRIPLEKLRELRGVGKVKAVQLKCLGELAARMAKASAKSRIYPAFRKVMPRDCRSVISVSRMVSAFMTPRRSRIRCQMVACALVEIC